MRKLIKIFSIEETNLAEDQAEMSKKMKIMRKQDEGLFDIYGISVQISTASAQVKLTTCKKQAMVVMEVKQAVLDDE